MTLSRDDAYALMTEWTASDSLRKHMLAVEAAVRGYARMWEGSGLGYGDLIDRLVQLALQRHRDRSGR